MPIAKGVVHLIISKNHNDSNILKTQLKYTQYAHNKNKKSCK
jgi:hypothetical protein